MAAIIVLILCNCKKGEPLFERKKDLFNEAQQGTDKLSGGGPCNQSPLKTFFQARTNNADYNSIDFDSIVVFQVDSGRMLVYKVPFLGRNPSTDFILVAANPNHSMYKGNIIHIEPDRNWKDKGSFSGNVIFQSLRRDTTETMNIVDGHRTNLLTNAKLVLPSFGFLEAVVISYTIPNSSGIDFGLWANLLSWVGVSGGSIGPGNGLSSSFVGSSGYNVYGPTNGIGGVNAGNSQVGGYGYSSPICNSILAPTIVIGTSNPYDPNHPFNNIYNPVQTLDGPIISNGVIIDQLTPAQSPQPLTIIGYSKRNPPNVEDMAFGSPSSYGANSQDIYLNGETDDNLFSEMHNLFWYCTAFDSQLAEVGNEMIQRFHDRVGGEYENPVLNQRVGVSSALINYLKRFGSKLNTQLSQVNFDINSVGAIDMQTDRPTFNGSFNKFNGLQILINDTEENLIELENFHHFGNGQWEAEISIIIYDHFGLDKADALKFQDSHKGFAAWWQLQHTRGYVPITTRVKGRFRIRVGF